MKNYKLDIGGPKGNSFYILGLVKKLVGSEIEHKKIAEEMTKSDYENLIKVFNKYFPLVELYSYYILGGIDQKYYTLIKKGEITEL